MYVIYHLIILINIGIDDCEMIIAGINRNKVLTLRSIPMFLEPRRHGDGGFLRKWRETLLSRRYKRFRKCCPEITESDFPASGCGGRPGLERHGSGRLQFVV